MQLITKSMRYRDSSSSYVFGLWVRCVLCMSRFWFCLFLQQILFFITLVSITCFIICGKETNTRWTDLPWKWWKGVRLISVELLNRGGQKLLMSHEHGDIFICDVGLLSFPFYLRGLCQLKFLRSWTWWRVHQNKWNKIVWTEHLYAALASVNHLLIQVQRNKRKMTYGICPKNGPANLSLLQIVQTK